MKRGTDDLEEDAIDEYKGDHLGNCQGFLVQGDVQATFVKPKGRDGWLGRYLKIEFTNNEEIKCPITKKLERGSMKVQCS